MSSEVEAGGKGNIDAGPKTGCRALGSRQRITTGYTAGFGGGEAGVGSVCGLPDAGQKGFKGRHPGKAVVRACSVGFGWGKVDRGVMHVTASNRDGRFLLLGSV